MPRVKRGTRGARRRKAVRKQAKGYSGSRHRLLRTAAEAVDKALQHAYAGRRLKKRDFRGLWQTRIAAASKANGISYSKLVGNLKKKNRMNGWLLIIRSLRINISFMLVQN